MKSRNVAIKSVFALLIFTLLAVVPQAFAQSDNACHADNPLHNTYYANRDCTTEGEWKVGWCLHKAYNEGWSFVEYVYDWEDGSISNRHWHWADEYNGSLCEFFYGGYSFDAQPDWVQEFTENRASNVNGRSVEDFEIVWVRPDRYHNTRAAVWDGKGYQTWVNRKLLRLVQLQSEYHDASVSH